VIDGPETRTFQITTSSNRSVCLKNISSCVENKIRCLAMQTSSTCNACQRWFTMCVT